MVKNQKKKSFFKDTTKGQIKKKNLVEADLLDITQITNDEYIILEPIFAGNYDSARKFMKHGPEVKPRRQYSIEQAIRERLTPVQLREQDFNLLNGPFYCSYSFMPLGKDKRKRKVSLRECLEGARIYAYANQIKGAEIIVKPYADSKRVARDGAEVLVEMPSRTKKQKRLRFKLMSVPVIDSPEKYAIALNFGSTHSCPLKEFKIRYTYERSKETSQVFNVCAHEIAGYLKVIEHFYNEEKNLIPLQMSQFAIPTQVTVDFYKKMNNNLLVRDNQLTSKDKLRKPRIADLEVGLWSWVKHNGHDKSFFPKSSIDGNVADYNWF